MLAPNVCYVRVREGGGAATEAPRPGDRGADPRGGSRVPVRLLTERDTSVHIVVPDLAHFLGLAQRQAELGHLHLQACLVHLP